jgi:hypothetical protein
MSNKNYLIALLLVAVGCGQDPNTKPRGSTPVAQPEARPDPQPTPAPEPQPPQVAECLMYPLVPAPLPARIGEHYVIQSKNRMNCEGQDRGTLDLIVGGWLTPIKVSPGARGGRIYRWRVIEAAWDEQGFARLLGQHGLSSLIHRYTVFELGAKVSIELKSRSTQQISGLVTEDGEGARYLDIKVASASIEDLILKEMLDRLSDERELLMSVEHSYFKEGLSIKGQYKNSTMAFGLAELF